MGHDVIGGRLPVVFLMGPTASGKTDVAAALADRFEVELVSVDAAQVYRGMDIGTAKPDPGFLKRYPHHLIDIVTPDSPYSAAHFVRLSRELIASIRSRGRIPLLVGGTLFYFNALERGLSHLPEATTAVRHAIDIEMAAHGPRAMHEKLRQIDPISADRIDANDRQRIQRLLEIYSVSGEIPSALMSARDGLDEVPVKLTLFHPDRLCLHERIALRFEQMMEQGLADEVRGLLERFPNFRETSAARIVGYRQTLQYLDDQLEKNDWRDAGVAATRQLAKRQLTWLRQQSGLVWFDAASSATLSAITTYLSNRLPDAI